MPGGTPVSQHSGSKGRRRGKARRNIEDEYGVGGGPERRILKAPEQEKLTEVQLKEEISRALTSEDPSSRKVVWSSNEREFIVLQMDQTIQLFHLDSEIEIQGSQEDNALSSDDEGCDAGETGGTKKRSSADQTAEREGIPSDGVQSPKPHQEGEEDGEEAEAEHAVAEEDTAALGEKERMAKLLNQFSYSERSSQTASSISRDKSAQTVPPPRSSYKDYCNAWIIYDAYQLDAANRPKVKKEKASESTTNKVGEEENKEVDEGKEKDVEAEKAKEIVVQKEGKTKATKPAIPEGPVSQEVALARSAEGLKILERLVMQNVHNDILNDFKYYEDAADEFRETGEGTLLPLWKFSYDKAKKHHVTSICWSQSQPDLFAVSYGSYDFLNPKTDGMVLIWSLRNTAFPEHIWGSPKGVMSCAIHPKQECLIAVGMFDGNVALLQLREDDGNTNKSLILKNSDIRMKHRSQIWSVRWAENDADNNPNFYSCGMDGQVIHWVMDRPSSESGGGLAGTPISVLHLPLPPVEGPDDGMGYKLFGCARCMAIHPQERTTFLVGTSEGNIFLCSMLYGSYFQHIYNAHFLPVAAVEWNYFHPDIFLSCSEDWSIKVWGRNDLEPMYVFEIGVSMLDCAWAPYSSTVFAAVSEEGKVLVYDLNVNKEKPCCSQQVVTRKKIRPNRVAFNPFYPIIIIGDDRGQITTLKLSPNLRVMPRDPKKGRNMDGEMRKKYEVEKMRKLLSLVRDPETIARPQLLAGADAQQAKNVLAALAANKQN